jgi:hypothetical protein
VAFAASLYRLGEEERALEVLDDYGDPDDPYFTLAKSYLLAKDIAQHPELNEVDSLLTAETSDGDFLCACLETWLLSGHPDRARMRAKRIMAESFDTLDESYRLLVRFIAEDLPEVDFRSRLRPSHWLGPDADYYIGLVKLANGDKRGAQPYFARCAEGHPQHEYWWSKAFLARMEQDKEWPAWIRPDRPDLEQALPAVPGGVTDEAA